MAFSFQCSSAMRLQAAAPTCLGSKSTASALRCAAPRRHTLSGRGALQVVNLSSNDLKNGMAIEMDGAPYRVVEFLHVKPGKGSAFVRSKLKNYITGNTVEKTFRAGEPLQKADMNKAICQFTYKDGDDYVFMDMSTYEETRIPEDDYAKYLKEGMEADILTWNGKVVGVQMPTTVTLKVTETDPGLKGNTAQGQGTKPATLETGAVVQVPLFIAQGELINVDTRTDTYLSRAKE